MEKEITTNEIMDFLVENMATKGDIKELHEKIEGVEESLRTEMSAGFRMVREELDDHKERLTRLEKRTIEDANAMGKDIIEIRQRVGALEKHK